MANYNWRVTDGDFGASASWANTTKSQTLALSPPGAAYVVNLVGGGGAVSGMGTVDTSIVGTGGA